MLPLATEDQPHRTFTHFKENSFVVLLMMLHLTQELGFFWSRKKCFSALADSSFGGGDSHGAAALRWSDGNQARSHRLQPFGGGMLEMLRHEGFLIPSRVDF